MAATSEPHILVVDDDTRLRALLQKFLTASGYRVTTAANAADARAKLTALEFDLLVVDVMMPGESGLNFTAAVRRTSDVPVLLLTAMGEAESRIAGLECGADDYLAKPFEPRELILRIAAILRRVEEPALVASARMGEITFYVKRGELTHGSDSVALTTAEIALLRLLVKSPGQTLTRTHLAKHLGGVSERTIDVQVTRLRRRIEPDPRHPRYLRTVRGAGYALWPD
ncbi:MAG: response regulator [Alphaproteobacteria bacterium]|nr:response regulator [Alphaproteobacteria bacterium]